MESKDRLPKKNEHITVHITIEIILSSIVIVLNGIEIIILKGYVKRKLNVYEMFIFSLSISDLLFGLSNITINILHMAAFRDYVLRDVTNLITSTYTAYFLFVLVSIIHLNAIGLDRLWSIYKPIKHNVVVTKRRIRIFLLLVWVFSVVASITLALSDKYTSAFKKEKWEWSYYNNSVMSNDTVPLAQPADFVQNDQTGTHQIFTTTNQSSSTAPPPPPPPRHRKTILEDNYANYMENVLSYFLIVADVMLLLTYGFIISNIRAMQRKHEEFTKKNVDCSKYKQALLICKLITLAFLSLTLPFPICRWVKGTIDPWVKWLMLINSGLNSVAYLVRGDYKLKC